MLLPRWNAINNAGSGKRNGTKKMRAAGKNHPVCGQWCPLNPRAVRTNRNVAESVELFWFLVLTLSEREREREPPQ